MKTIGVLLLFGVLSICCLQGVEGAIVINEILADPPFGILGDANRDGVRDALEDEFVELLNMGPDPVSLFGWTLSDLVTVRHTFSLSAMIPEEGFFVVFGGGSPFGFEAFETSSSGTLGLNNSGDSIFFHDAEGLLIDSFIYGSEGGQDTSLTRFPDGEGPFTKHSLVNDDFFSPGTTVDGKTRLPHAGPIPEPTTLSLLAFGLLGSGLWERKARRQRIFVGVIFVMLAFSGMVFSGVMGAADEAEAAEVMEMTEAAEVAKTVEAVQEAQRKESVVEIKEAWKEVTHGIPEGDFRTVAVDPYRPGRVYVGTSKSLYRTLDRGRTWKKVLSVRGTLKAVNQIRFISEKEILAATDNGLYYSSNDGTSWEKRFSGLGEKGRRVLSVVAFHIGEKDHIFVGTERGLFRTEDKGRHWERAGSEPSRAKISYLTFEPEEKILYAALPMGVYQSKDYGKRWERIFVTSVASEESSEDTNEDFTSTEEVTSIVLKENHPHPEIILGTKEGVYQSGDGGKSWVRLTEIGLGNSEINHLLLHEDSLYVATEKGVFVFLEEEERWKGISVGFTTGKITYLGHSGNSPLLWATSEEGIFKMKEGKIMAQKGKEVRKALSHFSYEPTIEEIQEAAIRYA
ncbi:lamin tail domain-containing protein, partial [candidate division TA06 bacterium]|nr:lamin tail domain-containing protein [candidate division TA06 bacterium]